MDINNIIMNLEFRCLILWWAPPGEIQLQYLNGVGRTQAWNFGELQTICHRNARWPWFVLPGERDASGAASKGPKPWVLNPIEHTRPFWGTPALLNVETLLYSGAMLEPTNWTQSPTEHHKKTTSGNTSCSEKARLCHSISFCLAASLPVTFGKPEAAISEA